MPGNEVKFKAHNFFAQEDLSSGHHHSPVAGGSWQGPDNNPWAGSQRQIGLSSSNFKGQSLQQSDSERGQNSPFQVAHGLNYGQPTLGPELTRIHSQTQFPDSNGYMHGRQILHGRPNEANFLGVDTESDQYIMTSRGLSIYESEGGNNFENNVGSIREESSESGIGFDFLGGQQQMSGEKKGMLKYLPQQLSGFNDMQLLQQQPMLRKMQGLQRQQIDARQHNLLNQNPPIINGTPIPSNNTWPTESSAGSESWLNRATRADQGPSYGIRYPPEGDQTLSLMGLIPPQVDQSLYGVPVSSTRGTPSHYSHISVNKYPMQQMAVHSNSSTGDEHTITADQVNVQGRSLSSRHSFEEENCFSFSGQDLPGRMYSGNPQVVNSLQMDAPGHKLSGPSETREGNAVLPVSSSQSTVALDPTEEKILFGDDNIWSSFGKSANIGSGSGGWSALMQSAVAETSNNDRGLQEEWSGPVIQNTEAGIAPHSDNVSINNRSHGIPGFQQSVPKYSYEHDDRLPMGYAHSSFHQSTGEGSKWSSRGPPQKLPAEGAQIYQNASHSSDAVAIGKSMLGQWTPQQNVPSSNQVYGKPNGSNYVETPSSNENELLRFYGNESTLQRSGNTDQERMIHEEMSLGVHMWKKGPGTQSTVGLEQVRTGMGSPQVNGEDTSLNNRLGRPNSGTAQASEGTSSNTSNLNLWKHAESSKMSEGNEPQFNRGSLLFDSSMNGSGNDLVNMHEAENSERKENSSDSHNSNTSHRTTAGGSNNKIWLDGSDTQNLLEGKQKLLGQGGCKVSGPRKFQYHPMGNLNEDVESSRGRKYSTKNQSHGHLEQTKIEQFSKVSSDMEKGHIFSAQQNKKKADDSPSDKASQSSQQVLKSLHMGQLKENSNFEGSVGPRKQNQAPSSHGFGLQLGFPSQLSTQNHTSSSHSSAQLAGSLSSPHTNLEVTEKDNALLTSAAQAESFPSSHETSEGKVKRNDISGTGPSCNDTSQCNILGNLNLESNSGFPLFRNQLQGQRKFGAVDRHDPHSLQARINQNRSVSTGGTSQNADAIASHENAAAKETLMGMTPNTWTKPPSQQNFMGGQPHTKLPPSIFCPGQLNNNNAVSAPSSVEVGSYGEVEQSKGSLQQMVSSADLAPKPNVSEGKSSVLKSHSDASPSNSASTEREFEAFGRSLKPNNLSQQTYSLLNQMRAMRSTEIDPNNRGLKRFKGIESSVGSPMRYRQSSEQSVMVGDQKVLSFSGSAKLVDTNSSSQLANAFSQDGLVPGRMNTANHLCGTNISSVGVEHSQISPQMAPSWFEKYGTFKNGQMSMYDVHKHSTLKPIENRFLVGKPSDTLGANNMMVQAKAVADSYQTGNIWQRSMPTPETVNLPPSNLISHDAADKGLVVARKKKQRSAAPLPSWHKEVTQGSQSLLTTSMSEVEWAEEANRLIDKVENEPGTFEDGPPSVRSKSRLIFTTQLMQQLFRPPIAAILSADAYSNYEAAACMCARLALGDACSLIPLSKSDSHAHLDNIDSLTDKHKITESEGIINRHLSEVTESFINRAKKLENDFMRLDKRASVVELRIESQELEKVSVINHFARFHGRGQADVVPPGPQRYVNALPIPRALPERVQCLSL